MGGLGNVDLSVKNHLQSSLLAFLGCQISVSVSSARENFNCLQNRDSFSYLPAIWQGGMFGRGVDLVRISSQLKPNQAGKEETFCAHP